MFSNLSVEAKTVVDMAHDESRGYRHYYIGVEHLFIGLCRTGEAPLGPVMDKFNLNTAGAEKIRSLLVPEEDEPVWGLEFIYTPRARNVLQLAGNLSKSARNELVAPAHILLAILVEGRSAAARVLQELNPDLAPLQSSVEEATTIQSGSTPAATDPAAAPGPAPARLDRHTPYLNQYGRDLTHLARRGDLDPVIGRDAEIRQLAFILKKKKKNSPMILGEAGVGKTHLVEGLAREMVSQNMDAVKTLRDKRLIEIDLNSMVAGSMYRGDFESRIEGVIKEATSRGIVLFFDEIHMIMDAGAATGAQGAAQILKPHLSRGDIQCIGATTLQDYNRFMEGDKALARRFETLQLAEPDPDETLDILKGLKSGFETHHRVSIKEDALKAAVDYAGRYISDRHFPDKAIDLLDAACAQHPTRRGDPSRVERDDIADVIFRRIGVRPRLEEDGKEMLLHLEESLAARVFGQSEAISSVVNTIRNARVGLTPSRGPDGVFLLCGPTGVGKTELVRALAAGLFGSEEDMIRLDMSEYMERHSAARLVGSPPGYVGHEEGGLLTESVRKRPYAIVLLDEIEKAHPDVYNILLQVFEEGRLTDGRGRVADFSNTVVFMTSNLGAAKTGAKNNMGFARAGTQSPEEAHELNRRAVLTEVGRRFRPEFRNRIDSIIVFKPLAESVIRMIIDKILRRVQGRPGLRERGLTLRVDESVHEMLMKHGYSAELGAREMERTVQKLVVDPLGQLLTRENIAENSTLEVRVESNRVEFATL